MPMQRANFIPVFVILALLGQIFAAACPINEKTVVVPAVVSGQEGGILRIVAKTMPGDGKIYTSILPPVGISTQLSQETAVGEAFALTTYEQKKCDVHFIFLDLDGTPSVDGPSAGIAMAVALRAALLNDTIRDDVAITGAIEDGGGAGQVGGIIDKAQASANANMSILITPKQYIYENILLSKLEEEEGLVAMEALNLSYAYQIVTSQKGQKFSNEFKLENNKIPKSIVAKEMDEDERRFASVAHSINARLETEVMRSSDEQLVKYRDYFETEVEQNYKIIEMGYAYTGANNAFLASIDAAYLSTPPRKLDIDAQIQDVQKCIDSLPEVEASKQNFQWIAGAQARAGWAQRKIDDIKNISEEFETQEEKYIALREINYAKSWCGAAYYIYMQAEEIGGQKADESSLAPLAKRQYSAALQYWDDALAKDAEAYWHIEIANESLKNKKYLQSIYDSAYAIGVQAADVNNADEKEDEIETVALQIGDEKFETLWAKIYQSQGQYGIYAAIDANKSASSSLEIMALATSMEDAFLEAKGEMSSSKIIVEVERKAADNSATNTAVGAILAVSYLLLISQLIICIKERK